MTAEWTPLLVALVSGVFLIPPVVISVVASRGEPRRLRELKALNDVLRDLPKDDDSYKDLASYRTSLAVVCSERSVRSEPGVIVMTPLIIGWLLASAGVFVISSQGKPMEEVLGASLVAVANVAIYLGFIGIIMGLVFAVVWAAAMVVRGWRRLPRPRPTAHKTRLSKTK